MTNSPYRDPLDGPLPKWERRKSVPSEAPEGGWWGHIPASKYPANISPQLSPPSPPETSKSISVSSAVGEKVIELVPLQSSASSVSENSGEHKPSVHDRFIANQLMKDLDINELFTVCSDLSGANFQDMVTPRISRLNQYIEGETVNPDNVLFLLRTTLKIEIPKK